METIKKLNRCDFLIKQRKECNILTRLLHKKMKARGLSRQIVELSYITKKIESYHDMVRLLSPFNNFICRELGVHLNNTVNFFSFFIVSS